MFGPQSFIINCRKSKYGPQSFIIHQKKSDNWTSILYNSSEKVQKMDLKRFNMVDGMNTAIGNET